MSPRVQLPVPKLGLSDDLPAANQAPLTSRRAVNVRLIDPRTGRSRVARRSGMVPFFTNLLPTAPSHLTTTAYNAPKVEYTARTDDEIAAEWAADLAGGTSLAVEVDVKGTVYVLMLDGTIRVYNADGALLDTIQVPLIEGEQIHPGGAFAVDEASRVYAVSTKAAGGANTRIFQWRRIVDPNDDELIYYDRAWTLEVPDWVGDIVARAGALWIARVGGGASTVLKYGGTATDEPLFEWETTVPTPVNGIGVGPTGDVYFSCPSSSTRGTAPGLGGLHVPNLRFTAHDLGYVGVAAESAVFSDNTRLHAWVDAGHTVQTAPGAPVTEVYDRRYILTQNTAPHPIDSGVLPGDASNPDEYDTGPADNTPRHLTTFAAEGGRRGPVLDTTAWAGGPALSFQAEDSNEPNNATYRGSGIRSFTNTGPTFKGDASGPQNLGSDTDATDQALTLSFAPLTNISINVGAGTNNGSILVQARMLVQVAGGPQAMQLRPLRDGNVIGPVLNVVLGTGTTTRAVTLTTTSSSDYGGTYTVEVRRSAPTGTVTLLGTQETTDVTIQYLDARPDSDGTNPFQTAIVPGNQPTGGRGDNWTAISAWKLGPPAGGEMRLMACQGGNTFKWALLGHTAIIGGLLSHRAGYVTFISNRIDSGTTTPAQFPGNPAGFQNWRGVTFDLGTAGPSSANPDYWALVTIQLTETTSASPAANPLSFWRINGRAAGRFRVTHMEAWGAGSHVMLGNKHWAVTPRADDLFPETFPFAPFNGLLRAWKTVYGSTTDPANGDPTTYPTTGGLPPNSGAPSGSVNVNNWDDVVPTDATSYTITATEVERLEGGLAHEHGLANFLPNGLDTTVTTGGLRLNHPFGGAGFPPTGFASEAPIDALDRILLSPRPILGKIGPTGSKIVWALNGSGLGAAVVAQAGSRHVVATGEKDVLDVGLENTVLRRVFDGGSTYSLDASDGAWAYDEAGYNTITALPRLRVDEVDQIYWPRASNDTLVKHRGSDGTRLFSYANLELGTRAVALPADRPVYPPGVDEEDQSPVFVYLASNVLDKLRIVTETQVIGDSASPRRHRYLAVEGRTLWQGQRGGAAAIVSGGTSIFSPVHTYIASAQLFQKHYFTDGLVLVEYDPITNTARLLTSTVRGEAPKRPRLMAAWQGRLVVARTQDDESTLFASRFGDPTDWDYFPAQPSVEDAWNSTLGVGPGSPPDMITALIELDDILIVGCDHSIYKLVGDPRAGGRIEQVSDQTGIAFGRSWAKDPDNRIYFFGQRGGVWRMSRGLDSLVSAERITETSIERRTRAVDLTERRVELTWNYQDEGLHAFQVPYS